MLFLKLLFRFCVCVLVCDVKQMYRGSWQKQNKQINKQKVAATGEMMRKVLVSKVPSKHEDSAESNFRAERRPILWIPSPTSVQKTSTMTKTSEHHQETSRHQTLKVSQACSVDGRLKLLESSSCSPL